MLLANAWENSAETTRSIQLLPSSHVALKWDIFQLEMRVADLIVLHESLDDWQLDADWSPAYTLWLNLEPFFFKQPDFVAFCNMVETAFQQLPRRVVRWADLRVRIEPFQVGFQNGLTRYSRN